MKCSPLAILIVPMLLLLGCLRAALADSPAPPPAPMASSIAKPADPPTFKLVVEIESKGDMPKKELIAYVTDNVELRANLQPQNRRDPNTNRMTLMATLQPTAQKNKSILKYSLTFDISEQVEKKNQSKQTYVEEQNKGFSSTGSIGLHNGKPKELMTYEGYTIKLTLIPED